MSPRRKLCNLCKAELNVPLKAQIVQCPRCRSINSYGAPLTSQYDNYAKAPSSEMNFDYGTPLTSQYDNYAKAPSSKMNFGYGTPLTSQYDDYAKSPPTKMNSSLQPQVQTSSPTPPTQTSPPTQTPPPTQTTPPQGSTRPFGIPSLFRSPAQTPPPPPTQISPPVQTSPPQGSPHSNNNFFQPPVQKPIPTHTPPPAQTSSPAQTHISPPQTSLHPPSPHVSPPRVRSGSYNYQNPLQPFPQISWPRVFTSGYHQPTLQDSHPVSSPNGPPVLMQSAWEDQRIHQYEYYKSFTQAFSIGNSSGALPYSFSEQRQKNLPQHARLY